MPSSLDGNTIDNVYVNNLIVRQDNPCTCCCALGNAFISNEQLSAWVVPKNDITSSKAFASNGALTSTSFLLILL